MKSTGARQRNSSLQILNRQRTRPVQTRLLRTITLTLLRDLVEVAGYELGIYVVDAPEMTVLNETFLRHAGSTDVITFDYADPTRPDVLTGEIFVCVDEALIQARRYRTTWQSELVRYVVHGVLHLQGHDDREPADRRRMKRSEERLLRELAHRFPLSKLAVKHTVTG